MLASSVAHMAPAIEKVLPGRALGVAMRLVLLDVVSPFVLAYEYRLLPEELDLTIVVPFCAFVGGLAGAGRALLMNEPEKFPKSESLRGTLYGAIFGFFFVFFGVLR